MRPTKVNFNKRIVGLIFFIIILSATTFSFAQNKTIVIPLFETAKCIICEGNLSSGGRWCDNADGTVTDMTTGLVWLKDAGWGGTKRLRCEASYAWCSDDWDDAHARAGLLKDGMAGAGLSDGSEEGDWRLPTKSELVGIVQGDEAVSSQTPHWFTGVQSYYYWSSTTDANDTAFAWFVYMSSGYVSGNIKTNLSYVWPVRGDN
jgi:hypothetical protein